MNTRTKHALLFVGWMAAAGCAGTGTDDNTDSAPVDDPTLVSADVLLADAPSNDELRSEAKADEVFPLRHSELVETQSPVKSQGSRGVCSIFSTVAYMEHLYIAEGTITDPDFSEQYLQWSAKFEVRSFPNTSGSNANFNLRAISDFGIPEESAWPYETSEWGTSDNPDCDGEDTQPTECYTNGHPPQEATDAEKFFLPRGRFISTRDRDIKAQIFTKKQAVVVGLTFFYQSWNHRRSKLPRNLDYWNEGFVLYPNDKDKEISLEKRAGHSIVLLGWDDELEVERRDENGDVMVDADGNPMTEKGFFLFKNSWGTGSFGDKNPHGSGYGWISMKYVREFGSGRVADLPEIEGPKVEICGDQIDNDGNGAADCDDVVCAEEPACQMPDGEIIAIDTTENSIPDNDPAGLVLPFEVDGSGEIKSLLLRINIEHTFNGDLSVTLRSPAGDEVVLHEATGRPGQDLIETLSGDEFIGQEAAGSWELHVIDHAAIDEGTVVSAEVEIER